jgi:hypothetical protein
MKYKFLLFLLFSILTALDSNADPILFEADSLFRSKKYTESKSIYSEITTTGKASPSLLLKLAYIDEGLGDYVQALFHLNNYYSMTSNQQALDRNIVEGASIG